ncbi:MAG TPA: c-type cytochrome [Chitinophagaceae bacterium]|nr:c-type cytochrome [Chitinophagaceae bacterium]
MRKLFILTSVIGLVSFAAYFMACKNKKSEPKAENKEDSLKKVLARGEYLVTHVTPCLDCHSKRDFTQYSGPVMPGSEGMGGEVFDQKLAGLPGTIYAKNITPDPETGIGTWTDDEIYRAITQGISKKGDTLFPIMPYADFNHMAKSDLLSIIAYIRTLKPIKNKVPDRQLFIPISMAYPAPALQPSQDGNMIPPESDLVKYGAYLVNAAVCGDCHTPMGERGPIMDKMFAGGFPFDVGTFKVNTANITPDSTTGIGNWNEATFLNKVTQYREEKSYHFNPGKQNTIMPITMYAGMTDNDLKAIYAYLRSLKPVSNKVEKWPTK